MAGRDVFSFHLQRLSVVELLRGRRPQGPGLRHVERFFTMQLGAPILSWRRYGFRDVATLAWWHDEAALDAHLESPAGRSLSTGWHVRLRVYRRWGQVPELDGATVHDDVVVAPGRPVVAVTLARLKLTETLRFTRFGAPVERQVRDHGGQRLATAAMRPPSTFCTFSVWRDEAAMVGMVQGRDDRDGASHRLAMRERHRRDFHHAFTTMRCVPLAEVGAWQGRTGICAPAVDDDGDGDGVTDGGGAGP